VARRHDAGEAPVGFFRPRAPEIAGAQARFDMADRDVGIECGYGGGGAGRGVALHQHIVWLELLEDRTQPSQDAREDVAQRLSGLHDVKIVIGFQREGGHHLIEHLAMLTGDADARQNFFLLRERLDHRCHFDGFRTCAEYRKDSHYVLRSTACLRRFRISGVGDEAEFMEMLKHRQQPPVAKIWG
jgi:hypothetical protein